MRIYCCKELFANITMRLVYIRRICNLNSSFQKFNPELNKLIFVLERKNFKSCRYEVTITSSTVEVCLFKFARFIYTS